MKFVILTTIFLFISISAQAQKFVAVTIDDLPTVTDLDGDAPERKITREIVAYLKCAKIPAIGFVNEFQLFPDGRRDEPEVNLLREWLNAGIDLGNHTYSHADINEIGLDAYEKDVLKGEIVTKQLLRKYGQKITYFRHPFLKTGKDLPTKTGLAEFLKQHNYTIAPVTIAVSDWVFAHAYDKALLSKNRKLMNEIGAAYVPFVLSEFDYSEKLSNELFGRNIKQILLLHANNINAEYLGQMIQTLRKRGYKFVSLKNALADEAYLSPDDYISENGAGWLERWAITRGKQDLIKNVPQVPKFVSDEADK